MDYPSTEVWYARTHPQPDALTSPFGEVHVLDDGMYRDSGGKRIAEGALYDLWARTISVPSPYWVRVDDDTVVLPTKSRWLVVWREGELGYRWGSVANEGPLDGQWKGHGLGLDAACRRTQLAAEETGGAIAVDPAVVVRRLKG